MSEKELPSDIETRLQFIETAIKTIIDSQQFTIDGLVKRVDTIDQILATLAQAYAEIAALVESLVATIINKSEDERKEFQTALTEARKQMMQVLQNGIDIARSADDKFVATDPNSSRES